MFVSVVCGLAFFPLVFVYHLLASLFQGRNYHFHLDQCLIQSMEYFEIHLIHQKTVQIIIILSKKPCYFAIMPFSLPISISLKNLLWLPYCDAVMYYSMIVSLTLRPLEVFGEECSLGTSISDPTEFLLGGRVLSFSFR